MNNWYHRLNFTINADYKIKPWLTSNSSLTFTDAKWDDGGAGYAGAGGGPAEGEDPAGGPRGERAVVRFRGGPLHPHGAAAG